MDNPDSDSSCESLFDEFSLPTLSQSQGEGHERDLCASDPTFSSKEEMERYLKEIGHKDAVISSDQGNFCVYMSCLCS